MQTGTQAIDRAAELLSLVVESEEPRTFTSLVEQTGLAKSTVCRLVQALERHRLLQRDDHGAFRPGAVFTLYALRGDPTGNLVEVSMPTLRRLGERTGETVNLGLPKDGLVITVAQVDSTYLLGAKSWIGLDLPAHCTSTGKVFYAFGALPLPDGPLACRTPHTVTDPARLRRELAAILRRGYAVAREELEVGLTALGAPVHARGGSVIAAVSVTGPAARLTPKRTEQFGALLMEEARALSERLGHVPHEKGAA